MAAERSVVAVDKATAVAKTAMLECDTSSSSPGASAPISPVSSTSEGISTPCSSLETSVSSLNDGEAAKIANTIIELYKDLASLKTLTPSPRVNHLFSSLVELCLSEIGDGTAETVLEMPRIREIQPHLRQLCSAGEAELERFWCESMVERMSATRASEEVLSAEDVLSAFPYYANYIAITDIEASLIKAALPPSAEGGKSLNITFIGSGPLPLTSLCLHSAPHFPTASLTNIDCSLEAIHLSTTLLQLLAKTTSTSTSTFLSRQTQTFLHTPASRIPPPLLHTTNILYLAALVGLSSAEKSTLLRSITLHLRPGTILIARSAHGLRALLYPVLELDEEELAEMGLEVLRVWVPGLDDGGGGGRIVNSVVVMRKI